MEVVERYAQDEVISDEVISMDFMEDDVLRTLEFLRQTRFVKRLFEKDPTLWRVEKGKEDLIRERLGWVDSIKRFRNKELLLEHFGRRLRERGITDVVVLGMGGSSMCPLVAWEVFGPAEGAPRLHVLNYTDPDAVREQEEKLDLENSLFIVASKSGKTAETLSLYRYFYDRMKATVGKKADDHFVAITDPGTSLEKLAEQRMIYRIFENPKDYGGRYSALSYFGLVPMAAMGVDITRLLDSAEKLWKRCRPEVPVEGNPGLVLGAFLASNYKKGRDKLTFILDPSIRSFGLWVQQLLAESTGKQGVGIMPVEEEPLGDTRVYGKDRVFVRMALAGEENAVRDALVDQLEEAGHPVIRITLADKMALGAEFYRWEFATAVAGSLMGINTFDEPNVMESKENTRRLLAEYASTGRLPEPEPYLEEGPVRLYCGSWIKKYEGFHPGTLEDFFRWFWHLKSPRDYLSVLAFFGRTDRRHRLLQTLRMSLRDRLKTATSLDYGPAYLHSTGQLYKGGPNEGLFLMLTADPQEDLPVPGEPYSFAVLQRAKALGDFAALSRKGRKVIRLHLGKAVDEELAAIERLLEHSGVDPWAKKETLTTTVST